MITRLQIASHLLEDVGREDDGLLDGHVLDQVAHLVLLVRVEAVRRLVEDQHRRVVQERLREADALLVALGERVDRLAAHRDKVGEGDRALDWARRVAASRKPLTSAMNPRNSSTVISGYAGAFSGR